MTPKQKRLKKQDGKKLGAEILKTQMKVEEHATSDFVRGKLQEKLAKLKSQHNM